MWEGLFILIKDLENQKDIVLGNIYRSPHDNNNQTNINMVVTELDPIFCKLSKETLCSIAGILYTTISDHYPYFLSLNRSKNRGNEPPSRYVRQRVNTESGRNAFLAELMNSDITSQLNPDPYCDPNINYDILHKHLTELKDKHLPYRLVKFNKYKHKGNKWITNGVLKSLKYKDRLYKQLRSTDKSSNLYSELKQKFGLYNSLLKKLIRECRISYYHQQFQDNKSDIKKNMGVHLHVVWDTM